MYNTAKCKTNRVYKLKIMNIYNEIRLFNRNEIYQNKKQFNVKKS